VNAGITNNEQTPIDTVPTADFAPFTLEETVPLVVDVLVSKMGKPGLEYLDRTGTPVPW
jgi:hypothetical protein